MYRFGCRGIDHCYIDSCVENDLVRCFIGYRYYGWSYILPCNAVGGVILGLKVGMYEVVAELEGYLASDILEVQIDAVNVTI